jgi:hypothetical protein
MFNSLLELALNNRIDFIELWICTRIIWFVRNNSSVSTQRIFNVIKLDD